MTYALGTSASTVREAPLLLIDLVTHEGVTGHAYQFCYRPVAAPAIRLLLDDMLEAIRNQPIVPEDLWSALAKRCTLRGVQGIERMSLSLVEVA